ncbi:MAG: prenyltransferase [Anaerolineales bacterium]|nr:prenyltransferase [Anaerolineae bacterium]PWB52049.1 MAG: prenyltransferase [Anaerolineales bacterium]
MNISMWRRALQVIPHVSNEEWNKLDVISKWLISTRAAVLIMTFLSGAFAGIFAFRDGKFDLLKWVLLTLGLIFSHATNNLLNDYTDFNRGVDKDNYYRAQYGPQPLVHGLMSKRQHLTYAGVTGAIALVMGILLVILTHSWWTVLLLGLGVFFVLFYTWPLKYIALGELSVLLVWGPLMIGGGYYVITGAWSWIVVLASLPYALGVTGVIFGKHIDKYQMDKDRKIHTLPVVIGEKPARVTLVGMLILQYILVFVLVLNGYYTLVMAAVLLAIPTMRKIWPMFKAPKPDEKPADYPDVWPNYFVAAAFIHNRSFGVWFMLALIVDSLLTVYFPTILRISLF